MKLTATDIRNIKSLGEQGMNAAEIARHLGLAHSMVWAANKRLKLGLPKGVSGSKTTWTGKEDAKLREMVDVHGLTIKDAAKTLNRSTGSAWKRCQALGICSRLKFVRWTKADEDKVWELWHVKGLGAAAIARLTGIRYIRVDHKIRRWRQDAA